MLAARADLFHSAVPSNIELTRLAYRAEWILRDLSMSVNIEDLAC